MDTLRQTTGEIGVEIKSVVESLHQSTGEIGLEIKSVVESLQQTTGEMDGGIKSVVEALAHSAEEHRNLTRLAFAESSEALAAYPAEVLRATAALSDLGKVTEQVLHSQGVLQEAMNRLGDERLANLLEELDATLKDLKPALANLAQPFVLQAVPVKSSQA
jgi:methyl-accepting chemotaxis protein